MITTLRTGIDHDELAAIHEPDPRRDPRAGSRAAAAAMRRHFDVARAPCSEKETR